MKRSARKDKRLFLQELAWEADLAAILGDMSTVFKIIKRLGGNNFKQTAPVKDNNVNVLISEYKQAARWVEHFQKVLNHPQPNDPANPLPSEEVLDIDVSPPTKAEVVTAIKAMKNATDLGIDSIHAEMLKADVNMAGNALTDLFNIIWRKEIIPGNWTSLPNYLKR